MPYTLYRIEKDGSETIIGTARDAGEASRLIDADKDSIDWEAGYHWVHEDDKKAPATRGVNHG